MSTHSSTRARSDLAAAPGERLELDLQRRERLPDVVVQIAREAPALFLLDFEQAPRERAQALVRKLELAVKALERLLGTQALGDVVDLHEPRRAAAPCHQVPDTVDVHRVAVLLQMPEGAVAHRAALAAQELAKRRVLRGAPDVERRHAEEFAARIFVEAQRRVVHREKAQGLRVHDPHRQGAALEEHAVAPLVRVDLVDQALQQRRDQA